MFLSDKYSFAKVSTNDAVTVIHTVTSYYKKRCQIQMKYIFRKIRGSISFRG